MSSDLVNTPKLAYKVFDTGIGSGLLKIDASMEVEHPTPATPDFNPYAPDQTRVSKQKKYTKSQLK